MTALIQGFMLGFSLIMAIGAQNAFVFRAGLEGRHIFAICLFCALSDAALIVMGVSGAGAILGGNEGVVLWLYLIAGCWLAVYGSLRWRDARSGNSSLQASEKDVATLGQTMIIAAGLTWLNPHVYLDTVVLLGGISVTLVADQRVFFGFGAALASFTFFFALGYGARALGGHLTNPKIWVRIDYGIALIMFWLAGSLFVAAYYSI
jgi:L-lysine exporter family protein LysE/ArgO